MRLVTPKLLSPSEGRVPLTATFMHAASEQVLPADQPSGLLAAALLKPENQDSFLAWGFFPEILARAPSTNDFVLAALGKRLLVTGPVVKAAFEAKLRTEPIFAADPGALALRARGPWHPYQLQYPIARAEGRDS